MELLRLFDKDRRSGGGRSRRWSIKRRRWAALFWYFLRLYSDPAQVDHAPAIHHGHGAIQTKTIDLGAWRYPATAFVALVIFVLDVVPLLSVLGGSFMTRSAFSLAENMDAGILERWRLGDPRILQGLHNTLIVAVSAGLVGAVAVLVDRLRSGADQASRRAALDSICCCRRQSQACYQGSAYYGCFSARRSFARSTAPSCFS